MFNPKDIDKLLSEIKQQNKKYEVFCGYCSISDSNRFLSLDVPKVVFNLSKSYCIYQELESQEVKKVIFYMDMTSLCLWIFKEKFKNVCEKNKKTFGGVRDIELLRFIEMGVKVKMIEMSEESIPVDRKKDLERVINKIKNVRKI